MSIPVLSVAEMREIEAEADSQGYSYAAMMEDAGRAVAETAHDLLSGIDGPRVTVVVGKGNNGGDGLVAARVLTELLPGVQIRAYLLDRREGDPLVAAAQERGVFLSYADDDRDGRVIKHMSASADLVIDALFGIGVKLPIREIPQRVLRYVRQALNERASARRPRSTLEAILPGQIERPPKQIILAVDCPSGLDTDTGAVDPVAPKADVTVTFIAVKPGLVTFPGAANVGKLIFAPLNMPETVNVAKRTKFVLTDNETVRDLLPERPLDGHKGTFGRVLLVAGSRDMPGAAGLAAHAAYRIGAGLVEVASDPDAVRALQTHLLEAVWRPLPDSNALDMLKSRLASADALVIGPGLGTSDEAKSLILGALTAAKNDHPDLPVVIDADALNVLSMETNWPAMLPPDSILTPHPGEMARLTGLSSADVQKDRLALALRSATEWNATVVLKGAHTIVAAPDGRAAIGPFKTDTLGKGGTGDVLTGLIGGLRAQGMKAFDAAQAAVYIHGLAATLAAEAAGHSASVLASEVADAFPHALNRIQAG